jgi:phosphate:Na+ symporter
VTTTLLLLPFVKQLVNFSKTVIREKQESEPIRALRFVDDHMLAMPSVALAQVKQEMDYMLSLAKENTQLSFDALRTGSPDNGKAITENEEIIDFTNAALTTFLIKLSAHISASDEATIAAYFHVLNDLERIGDHAVNFYDIAQEMQQKELVYSEEAKAEIRTMCEDVLSMFTVAKDAFENHNFARLPELTDHEDRVDEMKKTLTAKHYARLAEGNCSVTHSPYYTSTVLGLERVADHLVNVGYSIQNPTGSETGHL